MEMSEIEYPVEKQNLEYENNYHYGWKQVELESILLEGEIKASEVGIPPELNVTETVSNLSLAELMVYYKNHLTIALKSPEDWFKSSAFLREQVMSNIKLSDTNKLNQVESLRYSDDPKSIQFSSRERDKVCVNPEAQHEKIRQIREDENYIELSDMYSDEDDFLLACIKKKIESTGSIHRGAASARRTNLMPHGLLVHDDWHSDIFQGGVTPAGIFESDRINVSNSGWDFDFDAMVKMQQDIKVLPEFDNESVNDIEIPFPPNLTNGYSISVPYLTNHSEIKHIKIITFDNIERVPPKLFKDYINYENGEQKLIILARDVDGKLKPVKPILDGLVMKEKRFKHPQKTTIKKLNELTAQYQLAEEDLEM